MPLSTIIPRPIDGSVPHEAIVPPAVPAPTPRPPHGVIPRRVWLEHRAQELAAALDDHLAFARRTGERPDTRLLLDWTSELSAILSELHRKGDG